MVFKFIGILQLVNTLKSSQRRNIYVLIESTNHHQVPNTTAATNTSNTKPTYYSKKPGNTNQPKPKMSNSFELLTGPVSEIQKKYEILSDIVIVEYGGKVHGSQSHIIANNLNSLIVYYEVPEGKREEVKRKFENYRRYQITFERN